ncbi:tripartite motif-containing protein 2-like [Dysidea avara]|uniref:tripartite motif-containing protein 2-like n=1 Tax=Dysidea avara TaxID=196820 RepID=UPI003332E5C6
MAAKQLKEIVNTLSCPICSKLFKKPKYLPCHHSYCEQCLEQWKKDSWITCPECRKEWKVPTGGVKDFDNAFIINHMMDQLVVKYTPQNVKPEVECNECLRYNPIKAFCPKCSLFLCNGCSDYHKGSRILQDHHLVDLMEITVSTEAPDPQQCRVIDIPKNTIIGQKVEFTIITRDSNGDRCYRESEDQVSVRIKEINNTIVSENNDGVYVACFKLHQVGEVKVSVCVNEEHIKGSPYSIVAPHDYTSLCKPSKIVNNDGKMGGPHGIRFSNNGTWAIVDWSNDCVCLYDGEDKLIKEITCISSDGRYCYPPNRVAFDDEGQLYVTTEAGVWKFSSEGNYLTHISKCGSKDGETKCPHGLMVHNSKVYVADFGNNRIAVFLVSGKFQKNIGIGQLGNPYDVAVTSNDELLVADDKHNCIYKFTLDGIYTGKFTTDDDGLKFPRGIAVDPHGCVLVTYTYNHQVVIIDQQGKLIHKFGSCGSGDGEFSCPDGIAVNKNGDIYVADSDNNRIQIFSNY